MNLVPDTPESELEELAINTPAGLEAFLEYASDAYTELSETAAMLGLGKEDVQAILQHGSLAYKNLQAAVTHCLESLEQSHEITNGDVEEIQRLYNEVVEAGVQLEGMNATPLPIANVEVSVQTTPEVPAIILKKAVQNHPLTPEILILSKEDAAEFFEEAKETAIELTREAQFLIKTYESAAQAVVGNDKYASMTQVFSELRISAARAERVLHDLTVLSNDAARLGSLDEITLQNFEDDLEEIEKNLRQFALGFERVFPDILAVDNSPEKKSNGKLGVVASAVETDTAHVAINVVPLLKPISQLERLPSAQVSNPKALLETPRKPGNATLSSLSSRAESKRVSELSLYIKTVLRERVYNLFITEKFDSPVQFEALLRREISKVEAPSRLDSVLGIHHGSAFFEFLHDKTIAELEQFDKQPHATIRQTLGVLNVPYEVYVAWMQDFALMKPLAGSQSKMLFGELYVRAEIELLMDEFDQID